MKSLDNLSAALTGGTIDRRQFMRGATALGLTVSAATLAATRAEAMTPQAGGTLRAGIPHGSTTDSLDPATTEHGGTLSITNAMGNHLTEVNNDGQLIPELADSVEASADAKTWVFHVRQGVEFHDGKTLTPEDIIASINHHRGEDSKSAAKGLVDSVVDIKKDGENVVFELADGNADFPFIMSDYHFRIMSSDGEGNIDPVSSNGTGGYKLTSFEPGVRSTFEKNPNYWKEGRAHFDSIEMIAILDPTARQNAIMNGQVDVIGRVDPKTVALLGRVPTLNILETPGTLHYTFPMRLDVGPFDNYDLRMALKLAIKRQEMIDKILLGHGTIGNDHPISVSQPFHAGALEQREFDPEKAAFHYKKSGHSGAIDLSASDAAFAGAVDAAQLIAASAAEAGIEVNVVREPSDGYWSNVWNKKGWCACYWGGRPTADWMFSSAYVAETEWNDTAWRDTDAAKKFNDVVKMARAELDETKRAAQYLEAQTLIHDDGGAIVPMFANYIEALSKKLSTGEQVAGNWELDGCKFAERWWFNA